MAAPRVLLALALALSGVRGASAGDCKGQRRVLRGPSGFVTDGPGNYSVNGNCEWLVEGDTGTGPQGEPRAPSVPATPGAPKSAPQHP